MNPTCYIGPESGFFIFDEVRDEQNQHRGSYAIELDAFDCARIRLSFSITTKTWRAVTI